ncbi:hypothetical protein [Alteromonas sp. ASW11-130]|uniref:hypothetical protein n=1 Tax=Alteromonas sp. ASW11-130 TaxID=3015775 RepID=UPI0022419F7C|nr:hypothetical protein [Alteromonas sp. ASW11-130]MCW8090786.1 hypothetical protein [Alteromonas sp. ASW11-130]
MKYFKRQFSIVAVAVVSALAGCGGTEEQDIAIAEEPIQFAGRGVDGYIANAIVWVDVKANDRIDSFEPFAYTDAQGFYSYNPNTGVDYCAQESASLRKFCLETGADLDTSRVKLTSGVDLNTGEQFDGTLTLNISTEDAVSRLEDLKALGAKPANDDGTWQVQADDFATLVTPLTTIKSYLSADTELTTVLTAMGVAVPGGVEDSVLMQQDYIAKLDAAGSYSAGLFATAVKLQKLVDTVSTYLNMAGEPLGLGEDGLPESSADAVWKSVVAWAEANPGVDLGEGINPITNDAVNNFVSQITAAGISESSGAITKIKSETLASEMETSGAATIAVNKAFFNAASNIHDLVAAAKGAEIFYAAVKKQSQGDARLTSVSKVATYLINDMSLLNELSVRELNKNNGTSFATLDLLTISENLLSLADDNDTITADINTVIENAELADLTASSATSFWPDKRLDFSGVVDDGDNAEIKLFFLEDDGSGENGDLVICLSYRSTDPKDDIVGQRLDGSWSLLDVNNPNSLSMLAEGYSLQVKIMGEVLGSEIDEEVGTPPEANSLYGKYRFVLEEDSEVWYSDEKSQNTDYGLRAIQNVPADDQACRDILTLDDE